MKKLFALLMSVMMFMTVFSVFTVSANTEQNNAIKGRVISETTEYFSDGSSATVIVADESDVLTRASTYTKTGSKYYILRNKDRVRIITDDLSYGPRDDWEEKAHTSYAKKKIREFHKK